jgi:hypothetical protein
MQAILKIRMLGVRGALLAVLAAVMVLPSAQAQSANPNQKSDNKASGSTQAQPPSESSKATEKESAPANKEHAGGPQEGIKVHGHWVIDVRNPDGKLVTHREFENAYNGESTFLVSILARQRSVGLWRIQLFLTGYDESFVIEEPNDPATASSKNLAVLFSGHNFVLKGSFTPQVDLSINTVETYVHSCSSDIAPVAPCSGVTDHFEGFTGTNTQQVSVAAGQIVQVTVTISFS